MHRRTRLRNAMLALLQANVPAARTFVGHRAVRFENDELPALRVYCRKDDLQQESVVLSGDAGIVGRVTMAVMVDVIVKAEDIDAEDLCDAVCEQVEAAVRGNPELSGACAWCSFRGTEIEAQDDNLTTIQASIAFEAFAQTGV